MIGDMSARAPRTALLRLTAVAAAAVLALAACSSDDGDEQTDGEEPAEIVAVYEEAGQSDGGSGQFGGQLVVDDGCLLLDDGSGFVTLPAFSSAGEPYWDGEVLTFDGLDYDTEETMGFHGGFLEEDDESAIAIPDGCPDDLDVILIHATSGG